MLNYHPFAPHGVARLSRLYPLRPASTLFWLALIVLSQGMMPTASDAGIGPENLLVVVNADSAESRTIANHYVQLRQIPSVNVVLLKNVPPQMTASLEDFRERILKPVLAEIDGRGLSNQIRAVAYSSHFPYAIDVRPHHERLKDADMKKVFTPTASINGLTYLYRFIVADREEYLSPAPNFYARMAWERNFVNPFSGDDQAEFEKANAALEDKDFATAGDTFAGLLKKHPPQAPLAILAARASAGTGDSRGAIEQLNAAVAAGWTSRKALMEDDAFGPLSASQEFKSLVQSLNDKPTITQHPIAFEGTRSWTPNGWWTRSDLGGMTYLPSCMLAVVRGSGTTVDQAIEYLTIASKADNTFPTGTFYFTATSDVRTKTRAAGTIEAMSYLRSMGQKVELVNTSLPENKEDVLGVTFGTSNYDWRASKSKFVPGAIGDNLTSTSGVLQGTNQTVLTELLKNGAAIASGTVTEPYALQFKFPLPLIHAYYAEGLSAIEAYYLSLASPYQMLIVGDPLCQPFARQPAELLSGQLGKVNGTDALVMQTKLPDETSADDKTRANTSPISLVEFFLDGKLVHRTEPLENYVIQVSGLAAGSHEFRTVLIGDPVTAPRKSILSWIDIDRLFPSPEVTVEENVVVDGKRTVKLKASATSADAIKFVHFGEIVGMLESDSGTLALDVTRLGSGPIRLQAKAVYRGTEVNGREFTLP